MINIILNRFREYKKTHAPWEEKLAFEFGGMNPPPSKKDGTAKKGDNVVGVFQSRDKIERGGETEWSFLFIYEKAHYCKKLFMG